jgi:4-amino-4-deoxy-L-arabinose transferase-like glycosyltransferase
MTSRSVGRDIPRPEWAILLSLATIHALAHIFTNGNYGMFRDEFYYIACSKHLDWGYVDHPPLSIVLLAISNGALGTSVHAVRVLPALAGAGLVVLAGLLAREMGGRRFAQGFAALAAMISPAYLVLTGFYSMNSLDLLFWAAAYCLMIRLARTGNPRLWIALGLTLGLGLLNKISILFLGFGLVAGMVLTPLRTHFRNPYFWLGGLLAAVLFLPHILWQIQNGWPTLEFMNNARTYKISDLSILEFFKGSTLEIHPFNLPIWLAGLTWLLFAPSARRFRFLGLVFLAVRRTRKDCYPCTMRIVLDGRT